MKIPDGARPNELRYAAGATLLLWYLPLLVALFVGPLAGSGTPRANWLKYFVVLPGMLFRSLGDSGDDGGELAVAGVATLVLLLITGLPWTRWPRRRALIGTVVLLLSIANAVVLASHFAM